MDYAFCLLHIEEFEKRRSPLFGATGNFNHHILPYGILFLTFISTNVFYLRVGLKTGRRKTERANFDTFLDITFLLVELFSNLN